MKTIKKDLDVSQVCWLDDHNDGRDASENCTEAELNALAVVIHTGWSELYPVVFLKLTPERHKLAMTQLNKRWEAVKNAKPEETNAREFTLVDGKKLKDSVTENKVTFESHYVKNGKLVEPEFEGNMAFQRGKALFGALFLRLKQGITGKYTIPGIIKEYDSEYERSWDCFYENMSKEAGLKKVGIASMLKGVIRLREAMLAEKGTFKEMDCIKAVSAGRATKLNGTGKKLYAVITLDARFPELGLVKKLQAENGQELWTSLNADKMPALERATRKIVPEGNDPKTEADVAAYIAKPKDDDQKAKPTATKGDAKNVGDNHPAEIVTFIINCYINNDLSKLQMLATKYKELNAVTASLNLFPTKLFTKEEQDAINASTTNK